jgi:hypothetical protein
MKLSKPDFIATAIALGVSAIALNASADERAASVQDSSADATTKPFAVSLWNPVQTASEDESVRGLRLNLPYGKNHDVLGLDIGIANHATGQLRGVQWGLGGYVGGDVTGVQYNYIVSLAPGHVLGWQSGIYGFAGSLEGLQSGLVNHVRGDAHGAMLGGVNVSEQYTEGVAVGIVNYARRANGIQLGLVNVTNELYGVQIGLANYARNGFLPFFPIVNAAL